MKAKFNLFAIASVLVLMMSCQGQPWNVFEPNSITIEGASFKIDNVDLNTVKVDGGTEYTMTFTGEGAQLQLSFKNDMDTYDGIYDYNTSNQIPPTWYKGVYKLSGDAAEKTIEYGTLTISNEQQKAAVELLTADKAYKRIAVNYYGELQ